MSNNGFQVMELDSDEAQRLLMFAGRPAPKGVNPRTGQVMIQTERGFTVNSLLTRDEWVELDRRVLTAQRPLLRMIADLRRRRLTYDLGSFASLTSRWYKSSDVSRPTVNMTGRGSNRDLPDTKRVEVPVPVIFKDFELDMRSLMASRRMGDSLDTAALTETTQVIVEEAEAMVLGTTTYPNFNGLPLYGILNHPDRNTFTATGDWGTIGNIIPTITGAIGVMNGDLYYGPYQIYASTNQYNEASMSYFGDNTGETPLDRIMRMPQFDRANGGGFDMLPGLPDGTLIMMQMRDDVIDYAQPRDMQGVQLREWTTNDGLASGFKLMMVGAPRLKSKYDGKMGLLHITGA